MTQNEEIILTAETALRKINNIAKDAKGGKITLTPSLILKISQGAMEQIQQIRERQR